MTTSPAVNSSRVVWTTAPEMRSPVCVILNALNGLGTAKDYNGYTARRDQPTARHTSRSAVSRRREKRSGRVVGSRGARAPLVPHVGQGLRVDAADVPL